MSKQSTGFIIVRHNFLSWLHADDYIKSSKWRASELMTERNEVSKTWDGRWGNYPAVYKTYRLTGRSMFGRLSIRYCNKFDGLRLIRNKRSINYWTKPTDRFIIA